MASSGLTSAFIPSRRLEWPVPNDSADRYAPAYPRLLATRGNAGGASAALADLKRSRDVIRTALLKELPDEEQLLPWMERAVAESEAIAMLALGKRAQALAVLREAAKAEAVLPVPFGPPLLQKPSAELFGELLLADGQKAEAAQAFRTVLPRHPIAGLRQAGSR